MPNLPPIPDVAFSQRKNLLTRLERLQHIFNLQDHYENQGLCLALSVEYLIAQRQYGPLGGRDYISWLKSLLASDDPEALTITEKTSIKNLEKILRNRFRHQHLSTVLLDLIKLHASQNLEIESIQLRKSVDKKHQRCLSCLSGNKKRGPENLEKLATAHRKLSESHEHYGKKIESSGLQILKPDDVKIVSPLRSFMKSYASFTQFLKNTHSNKYFLIGTKAHSMAVTFHRVENESIWSFFDSNRGVYLYNDYEEFKSFIDNYFFKDLGPQYEFYGSQQKEKAHIDYIRLTEIDTEHYEGIWRNFRQKENIYVIDDLIKEKKILFFNKNTTARLLEYSLNAEGDINSIRVQLTNDNNIITVNAPFNCITDLYTATLNRIDNNERLVLNLDSVNPFDSLTLAPDLSGQVKQVISLIHKIALEEMHFTFIYKDKGYHKLLRDFFYDEKNPEVLNKEKLLNTVFNDAPRIAWLKQADQILTIADTHKKWFKGISTREALKKVRFWMKLKEKNASFFFNLSHLSEQECNEQLGVKKIEVAFVPHAIYIADAEGRSAKDIGTLGLAWLRARKTDQGDSLFLKGLVKYSLLKDQKNTLTSVQQQRLDDVTSSFETLKTELFFKTPHFFTELNTFPTLEPGSYILSSKKHSFILDIGEHQSTLYDPNIGKLTVETKSAEFTWKHPMSEILFLYLNEKVSDQSRGDFYGYYRAVAATCLFSVKKIDMPLLENSAIFRDFEQKLFKVGLNGITDAAEVSYDNIRLPVRTFEKMGAFFRRRLPLIPFMISVPSSLSLTRSSPSSPSTSSSASASSSLSLNSDSMKALYFNANTLNYYLLNQGTSEEEHSDALRSIEFLKKRMDLVTQDENFVVGNATAKKITAYLLEIIRNTSARPVLSALKNRLLLKLSSKKTNTRLNRANYLMQSYGYIRGFSELIKARKALQQAHALTSAQKNELAFEYRLALADFTSNIGIDITQYGLSKLGQHLQGIPPHLVRSSSSLKKIGFKAGKKLARFGGPFLSVLSAGFDIYYAWRAFDKLSVTENSEQRQDLIVSGVFSVLGASVAVSVGVAFMIGGRAAMVAGPLGLVAGLTLIAGSQLYSAIRQMNDIQKHIELSTGEILYNGWRTFWGCDLTSEVQKRYEQTVIQPYIRKIYDEKLLEQANHFLSRVSKQKISVYYYSSGDFTLTTLPYKSIEHIKFNDPYQLRFAPRFSVKILKDKIHPNDLNHKLQEYSHLEEQDLIRVVDSNFNYVEPSPLFSVDDICDVNNRDQNSYSVKKAGPDNSAEPDTCALFDFGDGNDIAVGYQDKKNIFKGGCDIKKYTGGKHADAFYLSCPRVPLTPSEFNGREGEDIIIAEHDLTGTEYPGYAINLETNRVHYLSFDWPLPLVANLKDIEHACGHKKTQDELTGNDKNNILNGAGGKDSIYGNGGNDILMLEEGQADGGEGTDSYIILKNTQDHPVNVNVYDDSNGELSLFTFTQRLQDITSVMLYKKTGLEYDIKMMVAPENDPPTTLFIHDAYRASKTDKKTLELNGQYLFFTGDGLLLFPDWPETITIDEQEHFSFTPRFYAQYSVMHDIHHKDYFQNTPKNNIQIGLEKTENNNDLITIGQDTVVLPPNIELRLVDTPFNDILKGHSQNNRLTSSRGNDILEGKGGQDVYDIQQPENVGRTVWINNKDTAEYPEYDLLMLPVSLSQISHIQAIGQDIVLSSRHEPDNNLKIRFQHFLQDESYRHITILDSNNHLFELNVDEKGQAYLGDPPSSLFPTEKADTLIITDGDLLKNNMLNAQGGSDVIVDRSDYHCSLYGGEGDDIIIALKNGHKKLYGDAGNDQLFSGAGDDDLTGGTGHDWLSGGEGNDQYFVHRSDGNTTIEDGGGEKDILVLPDMDIDELCCTKVEEDIYITLKNTSFKNFSIKLKAWSSAPEKKIEKIQARESEYALEDVLKTAISSFGIEETKQLIHHHTESAFSEHILQRIGDIPLISEG